MKQLVANKHGLVSAKIRLSTKHKLMQIKEALGHKAEYDVFDEAIDTLFIKYINEMKAIAEIKASAKQK